MLKRILNIVKTRYVGRETTNDSDNDLDLPEIGAEELIAELGLVAARQPSRSHARWRPPEKIVATAVSQKRVQWLQSVAPQTRIVAVPWNDQMGPAVADADAIIGWCTSDMLVQGRELRWIQLATAGIEQVLALPELAQRQVIVTNLQKAAGPVIAEHAFAMLLALGRGLPAMYEHQRQARWSTRNFQPAAMFSLRGRVLLVAGLGGIGMEVARIGAALGMRVDALRASGGGAAGLVRRVYSPADLAQALREADVVINTLPLTAATRGLFGSTAFEAMKPGTVFVNVSRGACVDTDQLVAALDSGKVSAAALDVTDPEPLPASHRLWKMRNVLITPHVAGWGTATRRREWLIMRENLRRYCAGEPLLSVVDVSRGY